MSALEEVLNEVEAVAAERYRDGTWVPKPGDTLADCEFVKAGFRSWGLEAADHSWRLVLSKLDFGAREPSALLTVFAPNHINAIEGLNWLVFPNTIGTNGGTNWNQCVKRLTKTLGADEASWDRRLVYLVGRARQANAGASNGTFSTTVAPKVVERPKFVFEGRLREGRTISLYGPGSAGKTTIVDALVASACAGVEIIPGWRPTRQFTCLVLDWDEGREEEEVRLAAICRAYGIDLPGGYHYKRQNRPLHDTADELGVYIVDNEIDVVVVSPMGRAQRNFGQDSMTVAVDEVHEILRSFGSTNILIDHVTGENMKGGAQREFGSVRKRDNVRGSYSLYPQSEELGTRVVVIQNTKPDALAPKLPAQAVRIEYDPPAPVDGIYDQIRYLPDVVLENGELPRPTMAETQPDRLARALLEHGILSTVELCARTGFDARRLRDIVREARKKGYPIIYDGGFYSMAKPNDDDDE